MISRVFPRLFGSFREGAIVHQKFIFTVIGASPTILHRNERGNQAQPAAANANVGQVLLARAGGAGLYTLTVVGGMRQGTLWARYLNKGGGSLVANSLRIECIAQNESTGAYSIQLINTAGTLVDAITINDEIHATFYTDK